MKFRFKNYKLYKDTNWITISPITIFLGANGTGKSSLLQPTILLSQTINSPKSRAALITNGIYLKAGNFQDIVNNHDTKKTIEITYDFKDNPKCKDCKECNNNEAKIGVLPPSRLTLEFIADDNLLPELKGITIYDCMERELLKRSKMKTGKYNISFISSFEKEKPYIKYIIKGHKPTNFMFDDTVLLKNILKYKKDIKENYENKRKPLLSMDVKLSSNVKKYLGIISFVEYRIYKFLKSIKYIGPIRDFPKRMYEYNKEIIEEVGRNGQDTATFLFQNNDIEKRDLLKKWLRQFNFAEDFDLKALDNHPELFTFMIKPINSDIYINYSDICFGLSQLLPIIVQSIYAKEGDIIITEQPELHLNPALEIILADFISEMNNKKKKFIIETHSEHFFLRLRTHIRKGTINYKDVSIYFTEKVRGKSIIKKIEIDENAEFKNNDWPIGFFEQSLKENLMFATARKNK